MNSLPQQKGSDTEISSFARSAGKSSRKKTGQENESDIMSANTKVRSKFNSYYILRCTEL